MARADVDGQVFSEKDLFCGRAPGEDGPLIVAKVQGSRVELDIGDNADLVDEDVRRDVAKGVARSSARSSVGEGRLRAAKPPAPLPKVTRTSDAALQSEAKGKVLRRKKTSSKKRDDRVLYWCETKYDVLPEVLQSMSDATDGVEWQEANGPDDDIDLLWCDHAITVERFVKMSSYQRVNHFVGMTSITKKNNLGRNLLRMKKRFPEEYKFFPDTWILPTDLSDLKAQFTAKKNKTFIVKPSDGYLCNLPCQLVGMQMDN